ncbi:5-oxoprolinase subunit PxpB [Tenuibacillus multivorans]|nr:5-oxoprolinase subunit PxpB [Tenuibacillus multivorans]GEL77124.1 allophanate hydrolase [Tenuibacillus multivorans]
MNKRIWPLNDRAITVSFGEEIDVQINLRVQQLFSSLKRESYPFIVDMVPTYTNLTIYFDPQKINFKDMQQLIEEALNDMHEHPVSIESKLVHIPVYYNGPELERVAKQNQLTEDDVMRIHGREDYLIYMIGFLPGFPYLGGLDERIATPRLDEPKSQVEAGSVGVANQQTGIYPIQSPGGWNIIGHTPVNIFDSQKEQPFMFQAGDYIQFYPVDRKTYDHIINDDQYQPKMEWYHAN